MPAKNDSTESAFKNWINSELLIRIAQHIEFHFPKFPKNRFLDQCRPLQEHELKGRVQLIASSLKNSLPESFPQAVVILKKAALEAKPKTKALNGFDLWPFLHFAQEFGLDHPEMALTYIEELTEKFTGEFAVRPFFIQHPKITQNFNLRWSLSQNHHQRRLASEGSRPRLPWGIQLKQFIKNPELNFEVLENLKLDDELYVRKSVANHINDISKDNPTIALQLLESWNQKKALHQLTSIDQKKILWITRHALRGLIKKGNPRALKLVGINTSAPVKLHNLRLKKSKIKTGEDLNFDFQISTTSKTCNALIDFAIHYQKSNGKMSPKVFKLTQKLVTKGEVLSIAKKHSFKPVTTRKLYPGSHKLEILINGRSVASIPFTLVK